jgi:nicotinamidase/pyrazinamidase
VVVVEDACRGIDVDGSMAATRASFDALNITRLPAAAIA